MDFRKFLEELQRLYDLLDEHVTELGYAYDEACWQAVEQAHAWLEDDLIDFQKLLEEGKEYFSHIPGRKTRNKSEINPNFKQNFKQVVKEAKECMKLKSL